MTYWEIWRDLATIDWEKLWEILSALASVVSALAAAFALWQVANQSKLQRREKYYDSFISGPVIEAVKEFRAKVFDVINDFDRAVGPLRITDPMLVARRGSDFVEAINREYFLLSAVVTSGAEAWGQESLHDQFRGGLESLQDDLTTGAEDYISGVIGRDILAAAVERNCAAILRIVRNGDPGTRLRRRLWRRK